jgi:hypothetical protein
VADGAPGVVTESRFAFWLVAAIYITALVRTFCSSHRKSDLHIVTFDLRAIRAFASLTIPCFALSATSLWPRPR